MKITKLTVLDTTETHIIAELEYSTFTMFGEKKLKSKVFKKLNDQFSLYWWFMGTGSVVSNYSSLNAILSTNKEIYEV